MKNLTKNTAFVGLSEVALTFVALARNKYLAVSIGPEGFGLFDLLNTFFNYAVLVSGTWMSMATLKYISEYHGKGDKEKVQSIFSFSFSFVVILAFIVSLILLLFHKVITKTFLVDNVLFQYFALFTASFFAQVIGNFFNIFLQATKQVKEYVRVRIITQVFTLVTLFALVELFDLLGFFINILIGFIFMSLLLYKVISKDYLFLFSIPNFKNEINKRILNFSLYDSFLGFIDQTVVYIHRYLVIGNLTIESLGIYSAAKALQSKILIGSNSSLFYFRSQMCETMSFAERTEKLNDYLVLSMLINITLFIPTILFINEVVFLLYSNEFLRITEIFIWFVISAFFTSFNFGLIFTIVGMAKLNIHGLSILLGGLINVLIPYYFISNIGLIALPIATAASSLVRIIISGSYLFFKRYAKIKIHTLFIAILSFTFVLVPHFFDLNSILRKLIYLLVFIIVFFIVTPKAYKIFLYNKLIKLFQR